MLYLDLRLSLPWRPALMIVLAGAPCAYGKVAESGGSVYLAFGLDPNSLVSQRDWQDSKLFRTPACEAGDVAKLAEPDLRAMFEGGQRKVGLILWHAHLQSSHICDGYLLNSANPETRARVSANLIKFVELAGRVGFNEVQIRFAPQALSNPRQWNQWNEQLFQENLSFVRPIVMGLKDQTSIRVVFDLGAEMGGVENHPSVEAYVKRMWSTMEPALGTAGTYGFSIAYAEGRLGRLVKWLREAGPLPDEIALDIYKRPNEKFVAAAEEARQNGLSRPTFLVQETVYDDPETYADFVSSAKKENVTIRAIMQWPKRKGDERQITESKTPEYIYRPAN